MFQFLPFLLLVGLGSVTSTSGKFPSDFRFGVATASYQIEGGWDADGKGPNIWDTLTHSRPEMVKDGTTGDVACDSYNLWKTDVQLLKDLGVHFYRFSLSWSRILPSGFTDKVNNAGVRYYNELINELLKHEIEPMVTLYHWDLPQPLQDLGGWPNPVLSTYFADYAKIAFKVFGDRVKTWITFNEPIEVCESGYGYGQNAPAINSSGVADYLCGHTILTAHAKVYRLYDKFFRQKQNGKVGITINSIWAEPKTNSAGDIEAAERKMQMSLGWWAHPIFSTTGDYPQIMKTRIASVSKMEQYRRSRLPQWKKRTLNYVKGTADFFGLNHYSTWLISEKESPEDAPTSYAKDQGVLLEQDSRWPPSAVSWLKVVPWGLRKLLNWIKNEYNNPLVYVTENGFADLGQLNDTARITYHSGYLEELLKAIDEDKCNVKAYTIWSLMDNMEWNDGYTVKFGLYEVNFNDSQRPRTAKSSVTYYQNLIRSGGNLLEANESIVTEELYT